MRKIKKLVLKKEVVSILNGNDMNLVKGGAYSDIGWGTSCGGAGCGGPGAAAPGGGSGGGGGAGSDWFCGGTGGCYQPPALPQPTPAPTPPPATNPCYNTPTPPLPPGYTVSYSECFESCTPAWCLHCEY